MPEWADFCEGSEAGTLTCQRRGAYNRSESASWKDLGVYDTPGLKDSDGENLKAMSGIDTITWGKSDVDIQLEHQMIYLLTSKDFPLALYGLSASGIAAGNSNPPSSPINALRNSGLIPSTLYSYTAGSYGRTKNRRSEIIARC